MNKFCIIISILFLISCNKKGDTLVVWSDHSKQKIVINGVSVVTAEEGVYAVSIKKKDDTVERFFSRHDGETINFDLGKKGIVSFVYDGNIDLSNFIVSDGANNNHTAKDAQEAVEHLLEPFYK